MKASFHRPPYTRIRQVPASSNGFKTPYPLSPSFPPGSQPLWCGLAAGGGQQWSGEYPPDGLPPTEGRPVVRSGCRRRAAVVGGMTDERAASLRLATTHLVNKIREGVSRRFMVYGFVWKKPSEDAGT